MPVHSLEVKALQQLVGLTIQGIVRRLSWWAGLSLEQLLGLPFQILLGWGAWRIWSLRAAILFCIQLTSISRGMPLIETWLSPEAFAVVCMPGSLACIITPSPTGSCCSGARESAAARTAAVPVCGPNPVEFAMKGIISNYLLLACALTWYAQASEAGRQVFQAAVGGSSSQLRRLSWHRSWQHRPGHLMCKHDNWSRFQCRTTLGWSRRSGLQQACLLRCPRLCQVACTARMLLLGMLGDS